MTNSNAIPHPIFSINIAGVLQSSCVTEKVDVNHKGKGKVIPLGVWCGPEGG